MAIINQYNLGHLLPEEGKPSTVDEKKFAAKCEEFREWLDTHNQQIPTTKSNESLYRWMHKTFKKTDTSDKSRMAIINQYNLAHLLPEKGKPRKKGKPSTAKEKKFATRCEEFREWLDTHNQQPPTPKSNKSLYDWMQKTFKQTDTSDEGRMATINEHRLGNFLE